MGKIDKKRRSVVYGTGLGLRGSNQNVILFCYKKIDPKEEYDGD